ncbi:MAG: DUF664 domain-containing protein [Flavobacteriales bacterium]|nr:DUF664 domain-containing protein [Flavobacteriales bacterium]
MPSTDLLALFQRDLHILRKEIGSFTREADLWRTLPGITNSAGNLCLHLCGNLRHYLGHVLGGEDYVRDRPREFSAKDLPKAHLLEEIDRTMASVERGLALVGEEALGSSFPVPLPVEASSTGHFLLHLYGHFNLHLGQVNYLRRILEA